MPILELLKVIASFLVAGTLALLAMLGGKQAHYEAPQDAAPSATESGTQEEKPQPETPATPKAPPEATPSPPSLSGTPPAPPPPPVSPVLPSFAAINETTRAALVNIVCTTLRGGSLQPITGSGTFIDPRGVILTNAHVAQYFLLRDYPTKGGIECVIRIGSPAEPRYRAELLYLSPRWIADNASLITSQKPTGTGENDFALLRITGRTDPTQSLPTLFAFVSPDVSEDVVVEGKEVLVAGYPAGFLGGISIQKDLYITSAIATIGEIFTFKEFTLDLFSLGGTVVAQPGSSGGAVVSQNGKLIGVVVTSSDGETTAERDLRAITLSHIDRSLREETGAGLSSLLLEDQTASAELFNRQTAPALTSLLRAKLPQ